jgi:hypothetical protein
MTFEPANLEVGPDVPAALLRPDGHVAWVGDDQQDLREQPPGSAPPSAELEGVDSPAQPSTTRPWH